MGYVSEDKEKGVEVMQEFQDKDQKCKHQWFET